jgi:hypothetical protein
VTSGLCLATRLFIDPIDTGAWWYLLLIPLCVGVSVVYKAVRVPSMDPLSAYLRQVAVFTVQLLVGMAALAAFFLLLVEVFVKTVAS